MSTQEERRLVGGFVEEVVKSLEEIRATRRQSG